MRCPFPGMDPYLERPDLWPDVHHRLISGLGDRLSAEAPPEYYIAVEVRPYLLEPDELWFVGRGDVGVAGTPAPSSLSAPSGERATAAVVVEVPVPEEAREGYIEIRRAGTHEVVTVLEILSPSNKRAGEGRRRYEAKRLQILGTATNLVEIDLVRAGEPMPLTRRPPSSDYRILVARGHRRPRAELYPFGVRDSIPRFTLPLRPREAEIEVDMGAVLHDLYERARYGRRIDYGAQPEPPLGEADAPWAGDLLRRAGSR